MKTWETHRNNTSFYKHTHASEYGNANTTHVCTQTNSSLFWIMPGKGKGKLLYRTWDSNPTSQGKWLRRRSVPSKRRLPAMRLPWKRKLNPTRIRSAIIRPLVLSIVDPSASQHYPYHPRPAAVQFPGDGCPATKGFKSRWATSCTINSSCYATSTSHK